MEENVKEIKDSKFFFILFCTEKDIAFHPTPDCRLRCLADILGVHLEGKKNNLATRSKLYPGHIATEKCL